MELIQNVLFLAELKPQSGNNSTAQRICQGINEDQRYNCICQNTADLHSVEQFLDLIAINNIQVVLGIHAYHAGRWLLHSPVPYVLIFGGTDVNIHCNDNQKLAIMREATAKARTLVAFSESVLVKAEKLLSKGESNELLVIPQAVTTCCRSDKTQTLRHELDLSADAKIVSMVGGIRPVKDQLYLLRDFSEWHEHHHQDVFLVIVGPVLHQEYADKVFAEIARCPGVLYAGGRTLEDTHDIIRDSYALVNSSTSEGQATAILEAMALGTAVLARDIPANLATVKHRHTGLVYSTPQDFLAQLEVLMSDEVLRTSMVSNAADKIKTLHSCDHEKQAYTSLIANILPRNTLSNNIKIKNNTVIEERIACKEGHFMNGNYLEIDKNGSVLSE